MARGQQSARRLQRGPSLREQYAQGRYQYERHGKREDPQPASANRWLLQMVASALILVSVIAAKLAAPDQTAQYRGQLLRWMGEDTEFAEVFSAVGRTFGGSGVGSALNDAYVAVFGTQEVTEPQAETPPAEESRDFVYDLAELSDNVELLQRPLGFSYQNPVDGALTSGFGLRRHPLTERVRFHYGLDIAANNGDIIRCFADGTVTAVGSSSDLGEYVKVMHANGYDTLYAHCSRVTASIGQTVRMGDPIAEVGDSGESTGPHLHFELHQDTLYLNPVYYVT